MDKELEALLAGGGAGYGDGNEALLDPNDPMDAELLAEMGFVSSILPTNLPSCNSTANLLPNLFFLTLLYG